MNTHFISLLSSVVLIGSFSLFCPGSSAQVLQPRPAPQAQQLPKAPQPEQPAAIPQQLPPMRITREIVFPVPAEGFVPSRVVLDDVTLTPYQVLYRDNGIIKIDPDEPDKKIALSAPEYCETCYSSFTCVLVDSSGNRLMLEEEEAVLRISAGILTTQTIDYARFATELRQYRLQSGMQKTFVRKLRIAHGELAITPLESGHFAVQGADIGGGYVVQLLRADLSELRVYYPYTGGYEFSMPAALGKDIAVISTPMPHDSIKQWRLSLIDGTNGDIKRTLDFSPGGDSLFLGNFYIFSENFIVFTCDVKDCFFTCLDYSGKLLWMRRGNLPRHHVGLGVYANQSQSLFFAYTDKHILSCWRTADGEKLWEQNLTEAFLHREPEEQQGLASGRSIAFNGMAVTNGRIMVSMGRFERFDAAGPRAKMGHVVIFELNEQGEITRMIPVEGFARDRKTLVTTENKVLIISNNKLSTYETVH